MKVVALLLGVGASIWVAAATVAYTVHRRTDARRYYLRWAEPDDGYPPYGV